VNTNLAVPACESAVRDYPNTPRFIFQLGRSYHQAHKFGAAVVQYQKATDLGFVLAQVSLGFMFEQGLGVPQDYAQAVSWCRRAADQENAAGQYFLGLAYQNGHGVPQDYAQAVAWLRKAADQGSAPAQYSLGAAYETGHGVPQDYAQAFAWYRKAADQSYAPAQQADQRAKAEREAREPINVLRTAYQQYILIRQCYNKREGYLEVFISEPEMDRAKEAVGRIEEKLRNALPPGVTTDNLWSEEVDKSPEPLWLVAGITCQAALLSLEKTYGELVPETKRLKKDF
jgi:hypothetical protein